MKKSYIKELIESIDGKFSLAETFHKKTKNIAFGTINPSNIPSSWITIHFKTYPRLNRIQLSSKTDKDKILIKIINARHSRRKFSGKSISYSDLSYLLYASSGLRNFEDSLNDSRRPYPSAGARYPLEIYPLILHCGGIKNGLYHFNVKENSLEFLLEEHLQKWLSIVFGKEEWLKKSAVIFFITGVLGRTHIKYGDRGYRYMLIEAGHLAQNILLLATELGLGTCPIGGFIDDQVNNLLDMKLQKEFCVYTIAVGKV